VYSFASPAAFVPHSAINLSVKPGQEEASPPLQSLDLSVSEAGTGHVGSGSSFTVGGSATATGTQQQQQQQNINNSLLLSPPPVLDLTRPLSHRYSRPQRFTVLFATF
jgi:hypothetical protein